MEKHTARGTPKFIEIDGVRVSLDEYHARSAAYVEVVRTASTEALASGRPLDDAFVDEAARAIAAFDADADRGHPNPYATFENSREIVLSILEIDRLLSAPKAGSGQNR
jgi:hypothetical protein